MAQKKKTATKKITEAKKVTAKKSAKQSKSAKVDNAVKSTKTPKTQQTACILRTPIVAVMGHVDHGKTTLLDTIRGTRVAAGEVGGITQNTRAHKVEVGKKLGLGKDQFITFIDTPGHEAFSEMRARGARVADIVVLVVAADDGVKPQTKESIKFIKESGVPLIIACNKIDAPGANIAKVKQELSSNDVQIEEYGGDAVFVPVSAIKGEGINDLLENILLVAEVHELYAEPASQGVAEGFVLESNSNAELGPVALVILKSGHILRGQYIVSADDVYKIRATLDENQVRTETTAQGDPVWIIGLSKVLPVGENLIFFAEEASARALLTKVQENREAQQENIEETLDDMAVFSKLLTQKQERQDVETTLKVIVRADTQGTLEAITYKLNQLKFPEAKVEVFSASTGSINETDVTTARDVGAIILGFQVKVTDKVLKLAKDEKVLLRTYQLIYEMLNEIEDVVHSMVAKEEEIEEVAKAEVKQVFTLTNGKIVAGCKVTFGTVIKGYKVFVDRKGEEIGDGKIASLKYQKQEIKEAKKETECGIIIEPQVELQEGDIVVCYKVV